MEVHLGLIGEGVFYSVVVEILIYIIAPVMTSALSLSLDWPCVFHPAALVNVVDEKVAE